VLNLTPPALVDQWREQLAVKFNLPDFVTSASDEFREHGAAAWARFPRVVASLATARRAEHRAQIEFLPYDLVIVDEAHHLKNRASVSWKFANNLQKRYLLLLTATPVQNNLVELYNLITLLKPGQLQTPREFQRQLYGRPAPAQNQRLRELLADVMVRRTWQVGVLLPPRAHTSASHSRPTSAFYDEVSDFIRVALAIAPQDSPLPRAERGRNLHYLANSSARNRLQPTPPGPRSLAEAPAMSAHRATLLELAERAARIQTGPKPTRWRTVAEHSRRKILLFTHFRQTLSGWPRACAPST
jgi:hypothetical protein